MTPRSEGVHAPFEGRAAAEWAEESLEAVAGVRVEEAESWAGGVVG